MRCRFCGSKLRSKESVRFRAGPGCRRKYRELLKAERLEKEGNRPIFGDEVATAVGFRKAVKNVNANRKAKAAAMKRTR